MIPKVIHYCWLSNDPYPEIIRNCMDSWKEVMPDYEFKLWNTHNFNIDASLPYVREAFAYRKWAFVADYIRLYALYTEGGIYLDSDVRVLKRFDCFLNHPFFTSMEYHPFMIERDNSMADIDDEGIRIADKYISGIELQAAVMGAEKGNLFVKEILDWYKDKHFIKPDGTMGLDVIAPQIYARIAEKYGLRYKDIDQKLQGDMMVYRSEIFAGNRREATPASYAIHYCENSWNDRAWGEKFRHYWKFFCYLLRSRIK